MGRSGELVQVLVPNLPLPSVDLTWRQVGVLCWSLDVSGVKSALPKPLLPGFLKAHNLWEESSC